MASLPKTKPERKAKPAPAKETFSLVSNEKLLAIYAAMVKCRMVEQRAAALFQQGKLASDLHASSGREAAATGIAIDLQAGDSLGLSAGDWLPAMVKGMALESLFRVLAPASATPDGITAPIASAMDKNNVLPAGDKAERPTSVRERALAAQAAKQGSIVAAILPSDEQSMKPWHDVLGAAASQSLPIVFVHYGDAAEGGTLKSGRKSKNPDAFFRGVAAITVDALDAVAVYRVACEAIVRARQGRGATLLECATNAGMPIAESTKEGAPSSHPHPSSDPLAIMETYLKSKGIEPAQHNQQIVAAFNVELDLATRFLGP